MCYEMSCRFDLHLTPDITVTSNPFAQTLEGPCENALTAWNPALFPLSVCRHNTAEFKTIKLLFRCQDDTLQLDTTNVSARGDSVPAAREDNSNTTVREQLLPQASVPQRDGQYGECTSVMFPTRPEIYTDSTYFLSSHEIYL